MTTSPPPHHDGNGTTGGENATLLGESEGAPPMEYYSYSEVNSVELLYTLNRSLHQGRTMRLGALIIYSDHQRRRENRHQLM